MNRLINGLMTNIIVMLGKLCDTVYGDGWMVLDPTEKKGKRERTEVNNNIESFLL